MLKTYLYIPEQLDQKIKHTAKTKNKNKAEVIRQALDKGLSEEKPISSAASLLKLTEIGKKYKLKGIHDSSGMDELLWGKDWNKNE